MLEQDIEDIEKDFGESSSKIDQTQVFQLWTILIAGANEVTVRRERPNAPRISKSPKATRLLQGLHPHSQTNSRVKQNRYRKG